MAVVLGPDGTRGPELPKFLVPILKALAPISHFMFKARKGKGKAQGQPLLLLTTVGARTGKERHTIVCRFDDPHHPQAVLIVGSMGGTRRHPAWCYNLAKNPELVSINLGENEQKVRAESLTAEERAEAWNRIVSLAPGYGKYEIKTDRQMPVIRLTPTQ